MNNKTDKPEGGHKVEIEYLGWWGFALIWVKVFAIGAVLALILKYIFKLPLF